MTIRDELTYIFEKYREVVVKQKQLKDPQIHRAFSNIVGSLAGSPAVQQNPNLTVTYGIGKGEPAFVPWVALLDRRLTSTTQRDIYMVYLFCEDMSGVYLTLNQGVEKLREDKGSGEAARILHERSRQIRTTLQPLGLNGFFFDDGIDLHTTSARGKAYQAGSICYKYYDAHDLPAVEALVQDLGHLTAAYNDYAEQAVGPLTAPSTQVWLFQANPEIFNLAERLPSIQEGQQDDWTVTRYRDEMTAGDTVLFWQAGDEAGLYALGEITASPATREMAPDWWKPAGASANRPYWAVVLRYTRILPNPILRRTLQSHPVLQDMRIMRQPQGTNFRVSTEEWTALQALLSPPPQGKRSIDWLVDLTLWQREQLEELCDALQAEDTVLVLAGPPGTGKTWVAMAVAEYIMSQMPDRLFEQVQFHPSYTYEDFIEGLRPVPGSNGILQFRAEPGKLLAFVRRTVGRPGPHVFLIDEINRGNLPRIFGELLFLLEYRDREIGLQYTPSFRLPKSIRFLATMNTADRSTRALDSALRRRFQIFECAPDVEVLRRYYETHTNDVPSLFDGFVTLNEQLSGLLDRHHTIGQTFFMADQMTRSRLEHVWRHRLEPLIEEYFFDEPDTVKTFDFRKLWPE